MREGFFLVVFFFFFFLVVFFFLFFSLGARAGIQKVEYSPYKLLYVCTLIFSDSASTAEATTLEGDLKWRREWQGEEEGKFQLYFFYHEI